MNSMAPGVIYILIMDDYHIHMMGTIDNQTQSLVIEVIHIPVGGMHLCQPVDFGINKSLKSFMREKWED